MAEASTSALPIGGYSARQLSDDERDTWNRQAEARRAAIRASAMLAIGRDPDGHPLPSPDAGEEERLATADLRAPLRQAQLERRQISLRLVERRDVAARACAHLESMTPRAHSGSEGVGTRAIGAPPVLR